MCIYISWGWVHAHEDRCLLGPDKEGTGSLGARVMDNCEQPGIGSGTRTQVLYKTSRCCYLLSHLSSSLFQTPLQRSLEDTLSSVFDFFPRVSSLATSVLL